MSLVDPAPAAATVPGGRRRAIPGAPHLLRRPQLRRARHQEMGHTGREPPFFFMKPADAVVPVAEGETGADRLPDADRRTCTTRSNSWWPSARAGATSAAADAPSHVWGYAVGLDMTRRDLQNEMKKQGRPWCIGKAFEQIGADRPDACRSRSTGELTQRRDHAARQRRSRARRATWPT